MGTLESSLNPFPFPRSPIDPLIAPSQIRGNDNQLGKALNTHTANTGVHLVTTTTANVSTATAIYSAITNSAYALVSGDDGAGKAFVDQVAWNGTSGTVTAISSTTTRGAPAARTYTVSSGVLKLAMAAGTYTIYLIPQVFST